MNLKWGVTLVATVIILGSLYLWQQSKYEAMADVVTTNYASRIYNIGESMEQLNQNVEASLLLATNELAAEDLTSIWRMTDKIRYEMGTLPFEEDSSTYWLNYLARIGDSAKLAEQGDIDFEEWKKAMRGSQQNLEVVIAEWERTNGSIQKKEDLLSRFYNNELSDDSVKQIKELDELVQTYSESDFPVTTSESDRAKKIELANLTGKEYGERDIVQKWKKEFPEFAELTVRVTQSKKDAPYPFYHIEFTGQDKKGFADYSKVGGHLLTTLVEQPYTEKSLDPKKLQEHAEQKMKELKFTDTAITASRENHNAWHYTFTRQMPNKAFVYSDSIQVKVAKDTGEILGMQPMEYVQEEALPDTQPIEISPDEILDPEAKVESTNLAYIENHKFEQTLCYEWLVSTPDGKQYKLFIDATTSQIVKKEKLKG